MSWPTDLYCDPGRRRFYRVQGDIRLNPSDYAVLNDYVDAPRAGEEACSIRSLDGGHMRFAGDFDGKKGLMGFFYGLPKHWPTVPRVKVALRNKPADTYGFHRRLTISDRAKCLLEHADPAAFEFMPCETTSRRGLDVGTYWLMDCARVVAHFDSEASTFAIHSSYTDVLSAPVDTAFDIHWGDRVPDDAHAFVCARMSLEMIWDDTLVDAWRHAGLTGLAFQPLQPPSPRERRSSYAMPFLARRYWQSGAFRDFPRGGVTAEFARERLTLTPPGNRGS